jgi:cytochrome b561/polyisoprenoid-binding protein YceI
MTTASSRYTNTAVFLHWLIAAAIIFQLGLGWRMGDEPKGAGLYALFQLHKSIGFTILFLSLLRVFWRLTHKAPALPHAMPQWEKTAATLAHLAFYGIMLGLPLTGWLLVSASSINIPTVLFGVMPFPHLPFIAHLATDLKAQLHELAEVSHALLALGTMALLALHIGAVLKHQLLVKDSVFGHMAVGAKTGWREWRLWLVLALVPAVFASAWLYPTPQPKKTSLVTVVASNPEIIIEAAPAQLTVGEVSAEVYVPAQEIEAVVLPVVNIEPVAWQVNAKQSQLGFTTSWSGDEVLGQFNDWQADIVFSEQALDKSSIKVMVNLAQLSTGDSQRDEALATQDWFNVPQYPKAIFESKAIKKIANNRYQAQGKLSLRDKEQAITLDFSLKIKANTAIAQGTAMLDRTAFGVGQGEWAATDSIPAAVKVTFKLQARAK